MSVATLKDIEGFPGYRVGDDGSVWSCYRRGHRGGMTNCWRNKNLTPDKDGYLQVGLTRNGICHTRKVHRLVLEAFVGPCPPGMQCCHNNDVPSDNRLGNLRWDTPKANQNDIAVRGKRRSGSDQGGAKLTEIRVLLMRKLYAVDRWSLVTLAKTFGVSESTTYRAVFGLSFRDFDTGSQIAHRPSGVPHNLHSAKLTEHQVAEIRSELAKGVRNVDLARRYGVVEATISNISKGKSWRKKEAGL